MSVTVPIKSIDLRYGSAIAIHALSWHDCEDILNELGEDCHTRIAYYQGTLEIMSPMARHERQLVSRAIEIGASSMLREFRKSLSNTLKES